MSSELLEVQEQLQRARDNLRHVEEGIKKTSLPPNLGFGDSGGRQNDARRAGGLAGVQRFRADDDIDDEPPFKKSLSSVASRLGPPLSDRKISDDDDDTPVMKSTVVTSNMNNDRENAKSIVSDAATLNRSKRLFGSLLMGTLRQFKQDKEKRKTAEAKQAEVLTRIERKEKENLAQTEADREKLVECKDGVKDEIRLLETHMDLAEMKVRADEERYSLSMFIQTKALPHIYYLPKEHNEQTMKSLKDSNYRVAKQYLERTTKLDKEVEHLKVKIAQKEKVQDKLHDLSTIKITSITKTVINENVIKPPQVSDEEKTNHPKTGIKVEVTLRENGSNNAVVRSESETSDIEEKKMTPPPPDKNREPAKAKSPRRRVSSPKRRFSPRKRSLTKRSRSPRRRSSPRRKSTSPRRRNRSPPQRRHSAHKRPDRRSSPRPRKRSGPRPRKSLSPKPRIKSASPLRKPKTLENKPGIKSPSPGPKVKPKPPPKKSRTKSESPRPLKKSENTRSAGPKKSKSRSKSAESSSSSSDSGDEKKSGSDSNSSSDSD